MERAVRRLCLPLRCGALFFSSSSFDPSPVADTLSCGTTLLVIPDLLCVTQSRMRKLRRNAHLRKLASSARRKKSASTEDSGSQAEGGAGSGPAVALQEPAKSRASRKKETSLPASANSGGSKSRTGCY